MTLKEFSPTWNLFEGAARGDLKQLEIAFARGAKASDGNGRALYLAVEMGRLEAAQFLLDHGAKADVVATESGETPLHAAARNGELTRCIGRAKRGSP
jgi:ankyrin repeat protein